MKISCTEFGCTECCKRYWITLLPGEAKKIAEYLGLGLKDFVEKKCVLIAHIYPGSSSCSKLVVNSHFLPKNVAGFAEKKLGFLPSHFLVLPSIALKRNKKGECIFLRNCKCEVHDVAPAVCKFFPFVSLSKKPLKKIYPFCTALQKQKNLSKAVGEVNESHKKRVNKYFNGVENKGFSVQWNFFPKKAVLLVEGEHEFLVSKKVFLQLIELLET